jgi:hypothetical protein
MYRFFYSLSLLSSLSIVALWAYGACGCAKLSVSHYGRAASSVGAPGGERIVTLDVTSWPGWVEWTLVRCEPGSAWTGNDPGFRWWASWFDRPPASERPAWVRFGFGGKRDERAYGGYTNRYRRAATPHWALALAAGVLPLRGVLLRLRAARRRRRGVCGHCAYDLRGTPDSPRCPECGTPVRPRRAPSVVAPSPGEGGTVKRAHDAGSYARAVPCARGK